MLLEAARITDETIEEYHCPRIVYSWMHDTTGYVQWNGWNVNYLLTFQHILPGIWVLRWEVVRSSSHIKSAYVVTGSRFTKIEVYASYNENVGPWTEV